MDTKDNTTIIGRYQDMTKLRRLVIVGYSLNDEVMQIFRAHSPLPDSYGSAEKGKPTNICFLVDSEKECNSIIGRLNSNLNETGYKVEYRGPIIVPQKKLSQIKTVKDLRNLVDESLGIEVMGKEKTDGWVVLDYKEILSKIGQKA